MCIVENIDQANMEKMLLSVNLQWIMKHMVMDSLIRHFCQANLCKMFSSLCCSHPRGIHPPPKFKPQWLEFIIHEALSHSGAIFLENASTYSFTQASGVIIQPIYEYEVCSNFMQSQSQYCLHKHFGAQCTCMKTRIWKILPHKLKPGECRPGLQDYRDSGC